MLNPQIMNNVHKLSWILSYYTLDLQSKQEANVAQAQFLTLCWVCNGMDQQFDWLSVIHFF